MCVGIFKPNGATISKQRLREAFEANPDGWGIIWHNEIDCVNGLCNLKDIDGFDHFWLIYYNLHNLFRYNCNMLIHFRTASSGGISIDACHPHFVNDNLAFVQNGNLFEYSNSFRDWNDDKTDTQRFNEQVLQKLPVDFLDNAEIRRVLEAYNRQNMSKMIFMDNKGKVTIINEEAGEWVDGVYFSNGGIKNYTGYGYSGAYYYNPNDIRHPGGLISVQMFSSEDRKKWAKCDGCNGWFREDKLHFGALDELNLCQNCSKWLRLLYFAGKKTVQN